MTGDPLWVKTKLAHWSSNDRVHWKRISTLYESSGEFAGQDPRAALWGPMFVYDNQSQVWDLVYVAYRCAPNTKTEWRNNYEGTIWLAVSKVKGPTGIDGPYADADVILRPDAGSQPWEGLQGTDSFFPYQVGKRWLGFYGSANTEHLPLEHWRVGLAEATRLAGPWKRCTGINPVNIEQRFAENPIVTRLDNGSYIAVYDNDHPNAIGSTWSADGLHWMPGRSLVVQPKGKGFWAAEVRTPLGLVAEGGGRFTLFYTGYQGAGSDLNPKHPRFSPIVLQREAPAAELSDEIRPRPRRAHFLAAHRRSSADFTVNKPRNHRTFTIESPQFYRENALNHGAFCGETTVESRISVECGAQARTLRSARFARRRGARRASRTLSNLQTGLNARLEFCRHGAAGRGPRCPVLPPPGAFRSSICGPSTSRCATRFWLR